MDLFPPHPRTRIRRLPTALAIALLLAGCGYTPRFSPARTELAEARVELPMGTFAGVPALLAAGEAPYGLLVDTGATMVIFSDDSAPARTLTPRRGRRMQLEDAAGKRQDLREYLNLPSLTFGGARFANVDALAIDFGPAFEGLRPPVHGLLGMGLFRDCVLTIDYPKKRIVLERGSLPDANGDDVLPMRLVHGCPHVRLGVGERTMWALIDTGHSGTIDVSRRVARKLDFAGDGPVPAHLSQGLFGTGRSSVARLAGDVRVGRHAVRRPVVWVSDATDEAIIGSDLLKHFAVSFDQRKGVVRFVKTDDAPIETPPYASLGFDFTRAGDRVTVVDVHPSSGAMKAGLRQGDELVSIDDVPAADFTGEKRRERLARGGEMRILLKRAGREVRLSVPVVTLVP